MDLIIYFIIAMVWIALAAATVQVFTRKGQSIGVAILVGIFFGPLALIVGLIMPVDQLAVEERRNRKENERITRERYYANLQQQVENLRLAGGGPSPDTERNLDTLSTISASVLIASPFLVLLIHNEPVQIALGLAAVAGLVGLVVANRN